MKLGIFQLISNIRHFEPVLENLVLYPFQTNVIFLVHVATFNKDRMVHFVYV